jgi:putative heme iron utilization protein
MKNSKATPPEANTPPEASEIERRATELMNARFREICEALGHPNDKATAASVQISSIPGAGAHALVTFLCGCGRLAFERVQVERVYDFRKTNSANEALIYERD